MKTKTKVAPLTATIIIIGSLSGGAMAQNVVEWNMSSSSASINTAIATGHNLTTGSGLTASYSGSTGTFIHNTGTAGVGWTSLAQAQANNSYIDFTISVAAFDATFCSLSSSSPQYSIGRNSDKFEMSHIGSGSGTPVSSSLSPIDPGSSLVFNGTSLGGPNIVGIGAASSHTYRMYIWDGLNVTPGETILDNVRISFDGASDHTCAVVPEPTSITLLGLGALGFLVRRKR